MSRLYTSILAAAVLASVGAASARADDFVSQAEGTWRASKLPGVDIYGPDAKKVGDITDVMVTRDGKAAYVVIGVGGFLGLGEKNVAIPFDKVVFTQEPIAPPPASGMAAPVATGMAPAANVGLGTPAAAPGSIPAGAVPPAATTPAPDVTTPPPRSTSYPDHGTITYTADQLKAAPAFAFPK